MIRLPTRLRWCTFSPQIIFAHSRHFSHSRPMRATGEQSDFLEDFVRRHKPENRTIEHFRRNEWTRKIIEDLTYEAIPFYPRYQNELTNENRFFAHIVNTKTTIPHVLAFRLRDFKASDTGARTSDEQQVNAPPEVRCLMSLGRDLDSHPSIVHGGFQCVLFDEMAWVLILLHQHATAKPGPRDNHFTVSMTTKFWAPVFTPSDVLLTSRLIKREGRKWWTQHELIDSVGQVLTSAETFWITAKRP